MASDDNKHIKSYLVTMVSIKIDKLSNQKKLSHLMGV